jgi:uncharacterized RDD family membrane protein YckC
MKCPKCSYLSFEASDRCRNCGYDFALTVDRLPTPDLSMEGENLPEKPLDLMLSTPATPSRQGPAIDLDRLIGVPTNDRSELPLFAADESGDDQPLVRARATPRAPLAVRRTADSPRIRSMKASSPEPSLELMPEDTRRSPFAMNDAAAIDGLEYGASDVAGWGRRLLGAVIDSTILFGIDVIVLVLTLRLCGLAIADIWVLPVAPLVAFLALLNGGYLIVFTAIGGQTIGKMAAGIQVISDEGPVDFSRAALRAAGYLVSLTPAGLGLLPAFFGPGRRTLHDRLADTRVVRV